MAWHDQFQVEDEKVDVRWLLLAFAVVLLAVAGYYYVHDTGDVRVSADATRERVHSDGASANTNSASRQPPRLSAIQR